MHILGATVVVVLCLVGLLAAGKIQFGAPPPEVAAADIDPNAGYVRVDTATWGLDCAEQMAATKAAKPAQPTPTPEPAPAADNGPVLAPLRLNNVLRIVSAQCNGEVSCELPVGTKLFGDDPAPGCLKPLVVQYRCIDFGPLRKMETDDGQTMLIDCSDPSKKPGDDTKDKAP